MNSAASLSSVGSSGSCSSGEKDTSDISRRGVHRRVTFSLNPSLTIHEDTTDNDEIVRSKDVVITNVEVINEMKEESS